MLAKRQFDGDALAAASDARRSKEQLHMAREIQPTAPAPPAAPTPLPQPTPIPGWYRAAFPMALVLAVLLLCIGIWAVGALIYMHKVEPLSARQVHYPLIAWSLNAGPQGGYTAASRNMAWAMLLCLPVAVMLVLMAVMLRRRIVAARAK
jgi:hypothetical protein